MTVLFVAHLGIMTFSMFTGWYDFKICNIVGYAALGLICVHAFCSVIVLFFLHDGAALDQSPSENFQTILQRASAIALLILIHPHMVNYEFMGTGELLSNSEVIFRIVLELLFLITVVIHVSTSFSKSFVSLGLASSQRAVDRLNFAAYLFCTIGLIVCGFAILSFWTGFLA